MIKYHGYSTSGEDIKVKKKTWGTSWISLILKISGATLTIVFIALSYIGYAITDQAKDFYKPIEWDYSTIIPLETVQKTRPKPFFKKPPIAKDLQCAEMYGSGSREYVQNLILPNKDVSYAKSRIKYEDEKDLKTDCESIKNRLYFPIKPRTDFEANFPLAFVRIVYTD
uniref:Uncharacterized protein n=1 Tax=Acrobeloides nanus TaxID=290746 RepID=A0A914DPH0_9BILA